MNQYFFLLFKKLSIENIEKEQKNLIDLVVTLKLILPKEKRTTSFINYILWDFTLRTRD